MTRLLRRTALIVALTGALLAAPGDALANHLCGQTIANPGAYVLTHDHACPAGTAITVDTDNVNLDLGGHRVSGQGTGDVGIDITPGSDGVFVFNGVVRGFDTGIEAGDCDLGILGDTTDLTIENVTVRNSGTYGIALCPLGGGMQVRFSQVIGTGGTGIANAGLASIGGSVVISQSAVSDAQTGIALGTTSTGSVYVLGSSVVDAASTGVVLSGGGYGEFSDGWIRCPSDACTRGILMSTLEAASLIARNTIAGGFSRAAIEVLGSPDFPSVTIEDNVVSSVGDFLFGIEAAIVLQDRGGYVTSNTVRRVTGGPGIHAVCANALRLEDNVLRDIGGDGIVVDDVPIPGNQCALTGNADVLAGNVVRGADGSGIVVASGLDHQLAGNAVLASGLDGFVVGSAATGVLTDNVARQNGGDGFQLDTGALTLGGNVARRNGGWGFLTVAAVTDAGGNQANANTLGDCNPSHLAC